MQVLGAVAVLLKRYSGQGDIVVGSPVAGRSRREVEGGIGVFVNTVVMRAGGAEGAGVGELLKEVKEVVLGGLAHQEVPFEKVVEMKQPERDLSRQPLFQVMVGVNRWQEMEEEESGGLRLKSEEVKRGTAKFPA